jgi:putative DNA processing protein dprA
MDSVILDPEEERKLLELLELLALRSIGIAPRKLLELFASREELPLELPLGLPTGLDCYQEELERALPQAEEELALCRHEGISILPFFSPSYPKSLKALGRSRPVLLYALGDLELLHADRSVTIVGTRSPSPEGRRAAYEIARARAMRGETIISGLALGCDEAAHRGALEGGGRTIAVLATGLDRVHPETHASLQTEIVHHGGLLLSEYPLGTPVSKHHLIARDRIQAALGDELLIIECGRSSGTMHTVRFAERCRRPIFALPYPSYPTSAEGNELLLRSGRALAYTPPTSDSQ